MADVDGCAGRVGQTDFPRGDRIFACPVHSADAEHSRDLTLVDDPAVDQVEVLTVGEDQLSDAGRVLHTFQHRAGIADRSSVVRKGDSAGVFQRGHIGQRLSVHTFGDAGDRIDPCLCRLRLIQDIPDDLRAVDRRFGIGHTGDRSDAAGSGSRTAGQDILFMGLSGVAQMDVHINKTGENMFAGRVQQLDILRQVGDRFTADADDPVAVDQNIVQAVYAIFGADDPSALNQNHNFLLCGQLDRLTDDDTVFAIPFLDKNADLLIP